MTVSPILIDKLVLAPNVFPAVLTTYCVEYTFCEIKSDNIKVAIKSNCFFIQ
jgi:hypothetical protein